MNKTALRKILAEEGLIASRGKQAGDLKPFLRALSNAGYTGRLLRDYARSFADLIKDVGFAVEEVSDGTPNIVEVDGGGEVVDSSDGSSDYVDIPVLLEYPISGVWLWKDFFEWDTTPQQRPPRDVMDRVAKEVFKDRSVVEASKRLLVAGAVDSLRFWDDDPLTDFLLDRGDWKADYRSKGSDDLKDYDFEFSDPKIHSANLTVGSKGVAYEVKVRVAVEKYWVELIEDQ